VRLPPPATCGDLLARCGSVRRARERCVQLLRDYIRIFEEEFMTQFTPTHTFHQPTFENYMRDLLENEYDPDEAQVSCLPHYFASHRVGGRLPRTPSRYLMRASLSGAVACRMHHHPRDHGQRRQVHNPIPARGRGLRVHGILHTRLRRRQKVHRPSSHNHEEIVKCCTTPLYGNVT